MYFFFHLIAGILLGLLIGDLLRDSRWIIPCIIGAVLPDLIDKPVGYILLPGIVGYGRVFFHTLPVFAVLLIIGLLLWRYRKSPIILAIAIGILSHQLIDMMWEDPANWLYPFLGPYSGFGREPLNLLLLDDFTNPSEWLLAAVFVAGVVAYLKKDRVVAAARNHRKGFKVMLEGLGIVLWMISGLVFVYGLLRNFAPVSRWFHPEEYIATSILIAIAAFIAWRWGEALGTEQQENESHLP
jgi:membrane-bound metal-dependent hydrolase YbcI (DUF457 family)